MRLLKIGMKLGSTNLVHVMIIMRHPDMIVTFPPKKSKVKELGTGIETCGVIGCALWEPL